MKRIVGAVAICLSASFPNSATAEITRQYAAGFWAGALETDDTGAPFNCFMRAQHLRDGYVIFLRWGKDGFHLSLMDAG